MKKYILYLIACLIFPLPLQAKVELPEIISDHMVLQQKTQVKLWGKAKPNASLTVKASWSTQTYSAQTGKDGTWSVSITTPEASYEPQTLTFSDGEATTINNILIGEVWFCSGQSNMEMPLNGFWNNPIMGANDAIANASSYKGLRFVNIPKTAALNPQETCPGKWQTATTESLPWCSATAFYFASSLGRILDVPVGIINCSWGGSTVEGWLPKEILEDYPDIDLSKAGSKEGTEYLQPMIMYNGMLKPLQDYTIKGFLWYQGESNVGKHNTYAERMATMVDLWRKEWKLGELPFYYVELAPYIYGDGEEGTSGAYLREAQFKAQALIPNSGMVSTNDLVEPYEATNIHPKNKTQIGKRLSYMALTNTYNLKGIADRGPAYRSMGIQDGKAIISFDYAYDGYNFLENTTGFEIAGKDQVFHPANARVVNHKQIEVSNQEVTAPVAVRYAFKNFQPGNLKNTREQPAYPFRTDNW